MTSTQKTMLMISGALWLSVLFCFHFVMPIFAAMYADFGARLPSPTQSLIDCMRFFRSYPIATAIAALAIMLVGADIERRKSAAGMKIYFASSIFSVAVIAFAMFLPVFQLGAVAGGLQ